MRATRPDFLAYGRPDFGDEDIEAVATGAPSVVTVNSCTSALFLSPLVSNVQPGDEIICPGLTWCSMSLPHTEWQYMLTLPISATTSADDVNDVAGHVLGMLQPSTHARMGS